MKSGSFFIRKIIIGQVGQVKFNKDSGGLYKTVMRASRAAVAGRLSRLSHSPEKAEVGESGPGGDEGTETSGKQEDGPVQATVKRSRYGDLLPRKGTGRHGGSIQHRDGPTPFLTYPAAGTPRTGQVHVPVITVSTGWTSETGSGC